MAANEGVGRSPFSQGVTPSLKPREREVLDAILGYRDEHGYSPTVREVGAALRISPTLAAFRIAGLCTKGWLRRTRGVARGLVVLRRDRDP